MSFKEIEIKKLNMNPFALIGDEWLLVTAGTEGEFNTMTASWGGLGVFWEKIQLQSTLDQVAIQNNL